MAAKESSPSKNSIGLYGATALVVGNVVGAGFFLSPTSLAPYGAVALVGWILMCAVAMCLGLVFARLARVATAAGGPYGYARMAFGDFAGFLVAWGYWISMWSSQPAIALAFVGYLKIFFPALQGQKLIGLLIALGSMWIVALINLGGVKRVGQAQILLVGTKILPFLVIAVCGLFCGEWSNLTPFNPSGLPFVGALSATLPLTMFAFLGIESATVPADNVKDPKRTIPYATIIGTIVASIIYVLGTLAVMKAIPRDDLMRSSAPFADAAQVMWGPWGSHIIAFAALLSSLGALNGWTLLMSQVPMAAAKDGLLPRFFGDLNRNGVPYKGILISVTLSSLLLMVQVPSAGNIRELYNLIVEVSTVNEMVPYVLCCLVEAILYIRMLSPLPAYRIGPYMPVAVVGFVFSLWTIYGSGATAGMWALLLLLGGLPLYVSLQKDKTLKPELTG